MKQVNAKETISCLQAGTPQENRRVPEIRYGGQHARHGRATIPYIVTRLFSCAQLFVPAAILALAASCVTNVNEGNPAVGDGEHLVTLSFTVPGAPTRAMDETTVETIDVLLFDPSTDDIVYRAIGTKPVSNQFTVKLPANTYNIVVLANARAMIPTTYPPATTGASFTNDSREDVLAAITRSIAPVVGNQWPATFDRIPMWGYSNGFVVGSSSPTISLTRMIAKVDITVGDAVVDFWLANVRLYNYSTAGHVAPAALPPSAPAGDRY
ncbi:MAG: FimB/Mfa2 family fimbrial subunit, partial [Odoribacteraceae bacterium]|nr:FimB/Mfa2 family fimbrial subunit [Odoribacteraceae bacterium]